MLKKLAGLCLFWLLLFLFFRILFLFYMESAGETLLFTEYLQSLVYGLRLDISAACYFMIIPLLVLITAQFCCWKISMLFLKWYHYILIPAVITLLLANMPLYKSWGTLINWRALSFAADPVQMLASINTSMLISSLFALGLLSIFFIKVIQLILLQHQKPLLSKKMLPAEILLSIPLIIIGIRGGLQQIPINESAASFSSRTLLNDAATNAIWHLGNNISKSRLTDVNPYEEMDSDAAVSVKKRLFDNMPCSDTIVFNSRPNIIVILLESFNADIIAPLGGENAVTPFINSLADASILFSNIYASGRRTDQALPSVMNGFPAQPFHSVMRFTDKASALPSMPLMLKEAGYQLSFYYGGETGFSNMGAFLYMNGFNKIISKKDFPSAHMNSKWGAHDEFVLTRQLQDLQSEKHPFFSVVLTLTSHEPFEIPRANYFTLNDEASQFMNAARYTDECLQEYFEEARKQPWYQNTLFILMADHGHTLPKRRDYTDVQQHHIPLLITGGALKQEYFGKKIPITGGQHDIAATILNILQLPSSSFPWSSNLLDTCRKGFAYIDMDQSLGWVNNNGSFTYLHHSNKMENITGKTDSTLYIEASAYRQLLFDDFMKLGEKNTNR